MKKIILGIFILCFAFLAGCSTTKEIRKMEVTGYCGCGKCCCWERGTWKYLKLDVWNKYITKGNSTFSIKNLSFKIEENAIYALTGNNGSGKTTLLRLLVGLLKPESGSIKIFNKILTRNKQQLWQIRQQIGFLFQNPDDQLF